MHSLIFGEFPIKPGYISLNFCVARNEQKGERNMTTEKFVVALATGGILESKKREDLEKHVKVLEERMNAKEADAE